MELEQAIEHVDIMEKEGRVEYMMASTHSHLFGSALILATLPSRLDTPPFDALVLRYSMPHKIAAEYILLSKLWTTIYQCYHPCLHAGIKFKVNFVQRLILAQQLQIVQKLHYIILS